jgi:NitT/TauT family transport system permease protein
MSTESVRSNHTTILTRNRKVTITQVLLVALILGTIEFAPRWGLVSQVTLVPLSEMVGRLSELLLSGELTPHIIQTFSAVFAAFLLAIVTGLPAGVALWNWTTLKEVLNPYLLTYYAIPIFAFYPFLIAILGLSIIPIIAIAWAFSVVIIITNTASGLNEIPDVYPKTARDMNLSSSQLLIHVYAPAAAPYIFTGMKLGFIYALIGTIASEFILAAEGLGWLISYHYAYFNTTEMYAVMLLVIGLSLAVNGGLILIERRLYRRAGQ